MARQDDVYMTLEGGKELERTLLDLAKQWGPRNIRTAVNVPLKRAIEPVTKDIEQNTPVDTGDLKASVRTKLGVGPIQKSIKKATGMRGRNTTVFAAISTGWYGGSWHKLSRVEYGTRRTPAHRVITGALKRQGRRALSIFFREINVGIERTVNRLSKRKKLGKLKVR